MLPGQPYSSTLIDMCPYQASELKRMKRALIGGFSSLKIMVSSSVFPAKS